LPFLLQIGGGRHFKRCGTPTFLDSTQYLAYFMGFLSAIKELGLNFVQETVCCGDAIAKMSWQHFLAFEKDI
jgi:hypothetical protein